MLTELVTRPVLLKSRTFAGKMKSPPPLLASSWLQQIPVNRHIIVISTGAEHIEFDLIHSLDIINLMVPNIF